jgi:hypothetical protein
MMKRTKRPIKKNVHVQFYPEIHALGTRLAKKHNLSFQEYLAQLIIEDSQLGDDGR